jgi:hypothetical protein
MIVRPTVVLTVQRTSMTSHCSNISTTSDITTRNLYIESLKESLTAAREYDAKERTPAPDIPDPAALMCTKLYAQSKQFGETELRSPSG